MKRTSRITIESFLAETGPKIDAALDRMLPKPEGRHARLALAMRHTAMSGGKRFRPALCILACDAVGGEMSEAVDCGAALEMVHSYSLIHDDLPAMDDADLRRGLPSSHVKFGEAHAILAGDALLTLAFEALCSSYPETCDKLCLELAKGSGWSGMIAGQAADIEAEGAEPDGETVSFIHAGKTGALITAALRMGAAIGGADPESLDALTSYGRDVGLAFQIIDDVLDETSSDARTGKPAGIDKDAGKATYPAVYGVERSVSMANELTVRAVRAVSALPRPDLLADLAGFIVRRFSR